MYIRGLIPRNLSELAEAVPVASTRANAVPDTKFEPAGHSRFLQFD